MHARLVRAVEGMWNTHARPAIESERHHLAEGIQRLSVLNYVCEEYVKPNRGSMAVPSRFSGMYMRIHQRAIAALAWLLGNSCFLDRYEDAVIVRSMLQAYQAGEMQARMSMDNHASHVIEVIRAATATMECIYNHDSDWDGWHGVLVWGTITVVRKELFRLSSCNHQVTRPASSPHLAYTAL